MSYEGFTELLCANGHYVGHDVYVDEPKGCPVCGQPFQFTHGVDQTNGYDETDPHTCTAAKAIIGTDDEWHNDHYGNRYATQRNRYAPAPGSHWHKINNERTEHGQ